MTTIQILTKNNAKTINKTLDSIATLNTEIIVGDLGSTDDTISICQHRGIQVLRLQGMPRNLARNFLVDQIQSGSYFYIEPWEIVVEGHKVISATKNGYATVIRKDSISKEIRIWDGKSTFVNPVFETLESAKAIHTPLVIYSNGQSNLEEATRDIEKWKSQEPLASAPYYYEACILFSQKRYDDFLKIATHFLFLDKSISVSTIMTRYYCAMAYLIHLRDHKAALQNLNLCLCAKPLMAEFWCLTGDVFYHLYHHFDQAKEFYENAMILGSRRLRTDVWPMTISKYRGYPTKMIKSCDDLLNHRALYAKI